MQCLTYHSGHLLKTWSSGTPPFPLPRSKGKSWKSTLLWGMRSIWSGQTPMNRDLSTTEAASQYSTDNQVHKRYHCNQSISAEVIVVILILTWNLLDFIISEWISTEKPIINGWMHTFLCMLLRGKKTLRNWKTSWNNILHKVGYLYTKAAKCRDKIGKGVSCRLSNSEKAFRCRGETGKQSETLDSFSFIV